MIIEVAKERLIEVEVVKGGKKRAPKKRVVKQAEKQSNVCKKDDVPADEGVDVDDDKITDSQGLAIFDFLKSTPYCFPIDHKNNELKWADLHTQCEIHFKDMT